MLRTKTILLGVVTFLLGVLLTLVFFRGSGEPQAAAGGKAEIILYSEPNFQGREYHLYEHAVDLPYEDLEDGTQMLWNDNIRSLVVVSGTWRLWQNGRMNTILDDTPRELLDVSVKPPAGGWSSVVSGTSRGALTIASLELMGIGPDVSSIELVSVGNLPDWLFAGR
jgi:hypothetical protein